MNNQPIANPAIYTPPPPTEGGRNLRLPKFMTPKLIFLILGVVLIIEIFMAIQTFRQPPPPAPAKIAPLSGGKIVLISPRKEYQVGEVVPVSVRVVTGGHSTSGTDVIVKFDPQKLEATGSANLTKGFIYPEYPLVSVDGKIGQVGISGIISVGKSSFNGIGILATVNFKAKTAGNTKVSVEFKKGATDDSNIVEVGTSKDILEEVFDLELTVK
ncbi:hypothetical protein HY387_00720 [Candidatus Daviesbacteria bacterium]|nr:hypothetical protein [Candidatus Daviesbacteria bacterium]